MGWELALVLLTVVIRLPALTHPRPFDDERIFSVVAIEMLEGGKLYQSAVDPKPPLLFLTYEGVLGLVGRYNALGLHAAGVLWVLLTMAALYATARALFDRRAGLFAALLYCVYQPWLFGGNLAFNSEVLMNLPIAWAVFLTLKPSRYRPRPELGLAGIVLCSAFLLKQPAAIAAVPLGLYLLLPAYRSSRSFTQVDSLLHATWLTLGFFSTLGLAALALQRQGLLGEAYYWTIGYHDMPVIRWLKAFLMSLALVALGWPMVAGALLSARELNRERTAVWRHRYPELVALVLLLLASLIGTAASGRFYHHNFIGAIPALALLAAPMCAQVFDRTSSSSRRWFSRPLISAWLAGSIIVSFISHMRDLRSRPLDSDAARFIRDRSTPEDRILVWGQAAGLYLEAQRRPASRYFTSFPLTGHIFGWPLESPMPDTRHRVLPGAWETFAREITERQPRFIVDAEAVRKPSPWYPVQNYPVLRRLLERDYRLVERAREGWIYERLVF